MVGGEGWLLGVPQWRQLVSFAVENPRSRTSLVESISRLYYFLETGARQSNVACDGNRPTGPPAIFWWSELPRAPAASRTSTAPAEPATAIVQAHGGQSGRAAKSPFPAYVRCPCAWRGTWRYQM